MIVNELIMTHKTGRQQATGNSCPTIRQSTAPASQSVSHIFIESSVLWTHFILFRITIWVGTAGWDSCFVFLLFE